MSITSGFGHSSPKLFQVDRIRLYCDDGDEGRTMPTRICMYRKNPFYKFCLKVFRCEFCGDAFGFNILGYTVHKGRKNLV